MIPSRLLVFMLLLEITVFTNVSSVTTCHFDVDDKDIIKLQTYLNSGIQVIYLDFEQFDEYQNRNESTNNLNQTFSKITNQFSKLQKYSLLRWILTTPKGEYILGFPDDFNADTYNLLDERYSTRMHTRLKIYPSNCQYDFKENIKHIRNKLLEKLNDTTLPFSICHHFFEKQKWKRTIYLLTGYWLGYSLECFPSNCDNKEPCRTIISKSIICYLLFVIIVMMSLSLPLGFICLPTRIQNIKKRLSIYQVTDFPYSLSRVSLRINEGYSISESVTKKFGPVRPENRIVTSLVIFCFALHFFRQTLINSFLKDKSEYIDLYGGFDDFFGMKILMECLLLIVLFLIYMPYSVLYLSEARNNIYVFYVEQKTIQIIAVNIETLLNDKACQDKIGYTKFSHKFLNRIFVLFNLNFYATMAASFAILPQGSWYSILLKYILLVTITFFNTVINIAWCAIPLLWLLIGPFGKLFNVKQKMQWILALIICLVGSGSILVVYRILFISTLTFLLKSLTFTFFVAIPMVSISFKLLAIGISGLIYLIMFYLEFQAKYKNLLMKCLSLNGIDCKEISVSKYQQICDQTIPFRYEAMKLLIKSLFTSFYIIVLLYTISNTSTDKEEFLTSIIPVLIAILTPAGVNNCLGHDSKKDVMQYEEAIRKILEKEEETLSDNDKGSLDFACGCRKGVFCGIVSFFPMSCIFLLRLVTSCFCPCIFNNCWPRCQCELYNNRLHKVDEVIDAQKDNEDTGNDCCSWLPFLRCVFEM